MQIYEELVARGLIAQVTDEKEIRELINGGKAVFYIGFDPTADSLHVGHFMALCLMKRLQMAGNKPIALIGGGTGYIGDPSGRTDMRNMMTPEQIQHNCDCFKKQMSRFIDFSPVGHNVPGCGGIQACYLGQKTGGGGVDVHPHGVYAVLHHGLQGFCEPLLGHIVLVLAHANGLGFNLHQLRQGVLKPPGNGHSGAKVDVVFREFLRCQGGSGVHGSASLIHDHVGDLRHLPDEIRSQRLRLPGGSAVANGNVPHPVGLNEGKEARPGFLLLFLRAGEIYHRRIQHPAGGVYHRHLAPVPITWIQAHGHGPFDRRLQQQLQCDCKNIPATL